MMIRRYLRPFFDFRCLSNSDYFRSTKYTKERKIGRKYKMITGLGTTYLMNRPRHVIGRSFRLGR